MKWRRSSAGEESSSRRPYSHRHCRLLRLLRLRSRQAKERQVPGTTAPPAWQAKKGRRRAAASSVPRRQQSRKQNQAGRVLSLRTRLLHLSRQPYRLQATFSLARMVCPCQCRCRCTLRCLIILPPVLSSRAHKGLGTDQDQPRSTIAVVQRLPRPCTRSTRHASTHRLVVCGLAPPARTAPFRTRPTGMHMPLLLRRHYNPPAAHVLVRVRSIECQTTTLARPCLQRKVDAA